MSAWSTPTWAEVRAGWSAGWVALSEAATDTYGAAIQADPTGALRRVEAFLAVLAETRATLDRVAASLPRPSVTGADRAAVASWQALERRWRDLSAGFWADATPAPGQGMAPSPGSPEVGVAPVVLVVAGVAVGLVGIAWAIAAYEYAVNLREQTALAERELDARVEASRAGRPLQPTTLPPQPDPVKSAARGVGLLLVGGLVVTAGALALPALLRK